MRQEHSQGTAVVVVSHCSPAPPLPSLSPVQSAVSSRAKDQQGLSLSWGVNMEVETRRCVIHFAGSSYLKNTLVNVRAGLALVRRFVSLGFAPAAYKTPSCFSGIAHFLLNYWSR